MLARTLAAFLIGLVVTMASALNFEAKPPVEQFIALPAAVPVSIPASPSIEAVSALPKVPMRAALLPVKVVERFVQLRTAQPRPIQLQTTQAQLIPPLPVQPQPLQPSPPVQSQIVSPPVPQSQVVPPQPLQPHVVELTRGTNFLVQVAEKISAKDRYQGDTFRATLARPLIKSGFIIADGGSKVLGRIVSARSGNLTLTLTEINTTDGQRVPIRTDVLASGPTLMFQLTDAITLTEKLRN